MAVRKKGTKYKTTSWVHYGTGLSAKQHSSSVLGVFPCCNLFYFNNQSFLISSKMNWTPQQPQDNKFLSAVAR